VRDLSIGLWRLFTDLDLEEAKKTPFRSMHDCFTRDLKDGARPIDPKPTVLVCPCDGIVGASDEVEGTTLYQAKGFRHMERKPDRAPADRKAILLKHRRPNIIPCDVPFLKGKEMGWFQHGQPSSSSRPTASSCARA
jgi:hypothetical protein